MFVRPNRFQRIVCIALLCGAAPIGSSAQDASIAQSFERRQAELEDRILALIAELGSEQFARREKAQAELRSMGLSAFDALNDAQEDEDIEVSLRAKYLLRSMPVHWVQEDDPLAVKEILRGYDNKGRSERRNLMDQLAALDEGRGTAALCRLARFDTSNALSKQAALQVMRQKVPEDREGQLKLAQTISEEVGLSRRASAEWLRIFIKTVSDPQSTVDTWDSIARKEEQLFQVSPDKTESAIVRDLLRWQADLLDRLDRNQEAVAVVRRTIDLLDGSREQLIEMADWLMEREAWAIVEELAQRYSTRFEEHALLLYRLAEAQLRLDRTEQARETAARASTIDGDDLQAHIVSAYSLQERGLFDWSEREYRKVIELGPAGSQHDLRSRFLLSEMLHDLQKDLEAAKVLQDAVDLMDSDQNVLYLVSRLGRDAGSIRSRMHYFYGEHHKKNGDTDKQLEHLEKGIKEDPTDADVLIGMYRAEGPQRWRETTLNAINAAAEEFRQQIRDSRQQAAEAPSEEVRALYNRQLAAANNQLAWLIGNTEGDYDEAVRCSHLSLELRPNTAGYLDTLGRCYFAKNDLQSAIKYQSRAVELEPHSLQIVRQLEFFQKAQAERKEKTNNADG